MQHNFKKQILHLATVFGIFLVTPLFVFAGSSSLGSGGIGTGGGGLSPILTATGTVLKSGDTRQSMVGRVLGAACPYIDEYVMVDDVLNVFKKETIKKIQVFLNEELALGLAIDGVYGKATEAGVRKLQANMDSTVLSPWQNANPHGVPTGNVYMTTKAYINAVKGCPEGELELPGEAGKVLVRSK